MKSLRCSEDIVRQVIRVYLPGILILLLVLFADPVVVHAEPVRAETTARCLPSFPFRDGWLGADAAYSIPLSDGARCGSSATRSTAIAASSMAMTHTW